MGQKGGDLPAAATLGIITIMTTPYFDPPPASLLYVPGHKARALEKARGLAADMLIIDLEDAVPVDQKDAARLGAKAAIEAGFPGKWVALRLNAPDSPEHAKDLALLAEVTPDAIVLPKVDGPDVLDRLTIPDTLPVFAMVETPTAVFEARAIAQHKQVAGILAGLNDLAHELQLPVDAPRKSMGLAMQAMVLAARAAGKLVYDGVYNRIDDVDGFAREAREGRLYGFDGKTLIHPSQVDPCNAVFAPDGAALQAARALIAAATGGAERYEGRMIEDMHVRSAQHLVDLVERRAARRGSAA